MNLIIRRSEITYVLIEIKFTDLSNLSFNGDESNEVWLSECKADNFTSPPTGGLNEIIWRSKHVEISSETVTITAWFVSLSSLVCLLAVLSVCSDWVCAAHSQEFSSAVTDLLFSDTWKSLRSRPAFQPEKQNVWIVCVLIWSSSGSENMHWLSKHPFKHHCFR